MTSATTFTLVGVVNKFLTVLLNVMIWDKHSSPMGLLAVCLCLLAGSFYQQVTLAISDDQSVS
jgi:GDP-mannose transporter